MGDLRECKRDRRETAKRIDMGWMLLPSSSSKRYQQQQQQQRQRQHFVFGDDGNLYCARGVENCTEKISRIRYRTISDGWTSVLNLQHKHYHNQAATMATTMTTTTAVGGGGYHYGIYGIKNNKNNNSNNNNNGNNNNIHRIKLCCPYELARAYSVPSSASLKVARDRAIGDESDVLETSSTRYLREQKIQ